MYCSSFKDYTADSLAVDSQQTSSPKVSCYLHVASTPPPPLYSKPSSPHTLNRSKIRSAVHPLPGLLLPKQSLANASTPRPKNSNGHSRPPSAPVSGSPKRASAILSARTIVRSWNLRGMGRTLLRGMGLVRTGSCRWLFRRRTMGFMVRGACFALGVLLSLTRSADLGRIECTYEPAMTKAFLHGRTEAIRTVSPESVKFTKVRIYIRAGCRSHHHANTVTSERRHSFRSRVRTIRSKHFGRLAIPIRI